MTDLDFLIVAPVGRDSELAGAHLRRCGIAAFPFPTVEAAVPHLREGAAGLIVTDEALRGPALSALGAFIASQQAWSDLPVIILASRPSGDARTPMGKRLREQLGNVTVLDRPLRVDSFVTTVQSALRSRMRQYEIRDAVARRLELEESLRRAERLAIAGTMAANIAHEINNPLAALTNLLYLISTSKSGHDARAYADTAMAELQRVAEIVKQTLCFHRANLTPSVLDLEELIESTVQLFRGRLIKNKIALRRDLKVKHAYCSSGETRQCLVNLVSNAIDAMSAGGVLTIRTRPAGSDDGRRWVRLTVADTGSGIPEDIRHNIFNRFFTTKGHNGTGLGLWLSRDIIERNGGSIRFRSRSAGQRHGTAFSVCLPCEAKAEGAAASEVGNAEGSNQSLAVA